MKDAIRVFLIALSEEAVESDLCFSDVFGKVGRKVAVLFFTDGGDHIDEAVQSVRHLSPRNSR